MHLRDLEDKISPTTKAILVAHWGGAPSAGHLAAIHAACERCRRRHGFRPRVVEDASHAPGAEWRGRLCLGSHAVVFAFGGGGGGGGTAGGAAGGLLVCGDGDDCRRARRLRGSGVSIERGHRSAARAAAEKKAEAAAAVATAAATVAAVRLVERAGESEEATKMTTPIMQNDDKKGASWEDGGEEQEIHYDDEIGHTHHNHHHHHHHHENHHKCDDDLKSTPNSAQRRWESRRDDSAETCGGAEEEETSQRPVLLVSEWGYEFRMSELHAALEVENLRHCDRLLQQCRENYDFFRTALGGDDDGGEIDDDDDDDDNDGYNRRSHEGSDFRGGSESIVRDTCPPSPHPHSSRSSRSSSSSSSSGGGALSLCLGKRRRIPGLRVLGGPSSSSSSTASSGAASSSPSSTSSSSSLLSSPSSHLTIVFDRRPGLAPTFVDFMRRRFNVQCACASTVTGAVETTPPAPAGVEANAATSSLSPLPLQPSSGRGDDDHHNHHHVATPIRCDLQPCVSDMRLSSSLLPRLDAFGDAFALLPVGWFLTPSDRERIVAGVRAFAAEHDLLATTMTPTTANTASAGGASGTVGGTDRGADFEYAISGSGSRFGEGSDGGISRANTNPENLAFLVQGLTGLDLSLHHRHSSPSPTHNTTSRVESSPFEDEDEIGLLR
jgi:hypothetical protein